MKIGFVGGGNMASALIGGLLGKGWRAEAINVVEIDPQARERLTRELGVAAHGAAADALRGIDCVVLAVKPQQLRDVARPLGPLVHDALVVSIAAGVRLGDIARWLGGHQRVVRAMPNTPALVLAGMTGLYAPPTLSEADRRAAEDILSAAGATLWVDREELIDAVTAVSGSGPAYVFYFIEALEQAAAELGFDPERARQLALTTFTGAVKLATQSSEPVATLRARVTSKGGTTERAISEFDAKRVREAIVHAVRAAEERSKELGDALGKDQP